MAAPGSAQRRFERVETGRQAEAQVETAALTLFSSQTQEMPSASPSARAKPVMLETPTAAPLPDFAAARRL